MSDRTSDMRNLVTRLEEGVKDAVLAGLGSQVAQGNQDRAAYAKQMRNEYMRWLGRTNTKASELSLMQFLISQIGFTAENARKLFAQSGLADPTKPTESVIFEVTSKQVDKLFSNAAEFAFQHNLVNVKGDKVTRTGGRSTGSRTRTAQGDNHAELDQVKNMVGDQGNKPADPPKPDQNAGFNRQQMWDICKQIGLKNIHIRELNELMDKMKWPDIAQQPDKDTLVEQLAKIGYAFLKANGK